MTLAPRHGAALIVVACSLIAGTNLLSKMLGTGPDALSPFQITWGRYVSALAAIGIFYIARRPRITAMNLPLHAVRVGFGALGVTAMFASATLIPLADSTAISLLNAIIAVALSHFILRERVGRVRWSAAGVAFIGALLLVRPGTASFQPFALIALLAAFLLAGEIIALKLLTRGEGVFQILLASNIGGSVLLTILSLFVWQSPTGEQWLMLGGIGLLMVAAQALFVPALRSGDTSFIAPFTYSALLFATLYDFALFGVVPVFWSVVGGLVVVGAGVVLALRGSS